ncbi:hypothetical protein [uncultured Faecalibaculum sp.]|uniref:hypothetical protein n=2 Tax=uncultured Faecalibaculum sp. TaxID=1729681 RepID=UPI0026059FAA|nr:hypothetical protein [uncultured Faecalibaculum sp.]
MAAMPYPWLSATDKSLLDCDDVLEAIDRKEWSKGKKDLYAQYYLEQRAKYTEEERMKEFRLDQGNLKSWRRQSAFKRFATEYEHRELDKYRISSMITTICMTLVLFFAKAVWEGEYFINFSVDAIVGVVALVVAVSQYRIKYSVISRFAGIRDYLLMDVLSIAVCLLLKTWLPANLDFSLFVLLLNYFLQKKRFEEAEKRFSTEV